jgi:hypothetical protein
MSINESSSGALFKLPVAVLSRFVTKHVPYSWHICVSGIAPQVTSLRACCVLLLSEEILIDYVNNLVRKIVIILLVKFFNSFRFVSVIKVALL